MGVKRFEIYLVNLDATIGHEIKKTRPCVIISPNEMNEAISTVLIAPMTTKGRLYPTRVNLTFQNKEGQIVLDQIRAIDKIRLVSKIGEIDSKTQDKILQVLKEIFSL